jgi:two-component system response regulator PhoP
MKQQANSSGPIVAIIEDVDALREFYSLSLATAGIDAKGYQSAEAYYRDAITRPADIVLVDLGLPGEDGLSAIRHLRKIKSLGIIVITGRGTSDDKEAGIAAGADEYFVKPVERLDLIAAINGLWQRMKDNRRVPSRSGKAWKLDLVQSTLLTPEGGTMSLTASETVLLACLAEHPGAAVTKEELCARLFSGETGVSYHRIEVLVSRLRKKFKQFNTAAPLRSIFGKGLAFSEEIEILERDA